MPSAIIARQPSRHRVHSRPHAPAFRLSHAAALVGLLLAAPVWATIYGPGAVTGLKGLQGGDIVAAGTTATAAADTNVFVLDPAVPGAVTIGGAGAASTISADSANALSDKYACTDSTARPNFTVSIVNTTLSSTLNHAIATCNNVIDLSNASGTTLSIDHSTITSTNPGAVPYQSSHRGYGVIASGISSVSLTSSNISTVLGNALDTRRVPSVTVKGSQMVGAGNIAGNFVQAQTVTVGDDADGNHSSFTHSVSVEPAVYVGAWGVTPSQNTASFTNTAFASDSPGGSNTRGYMYDSGTYPSSGLFNDAANSTLTGGSINTTGASATGIINTDNSAGAQSYGPIVLVQGGTQIVTQGDDGANGVTANLGATTTLTGAVITTQGNSSHGVQTTDNDERNPSLVLTGAGQRTTVTTINGGSVTVNGSNSIGLLLQNSLTSTAATRASMVLTGALSVSSPDAGSGGIVVSGDYSVVDGSGLAGASITAGGVALDMGLGKAQSLTVANATVSSTGGPLIKTQQSGASALPSTLTLTNVQASAASGQMVLDATVSSFLNVNASGSTLSGKVTADSTSTVNLSLASASKLTGAIDPVNLTVDASSQWVMPANSTVNNVTNNGTVQFADSTQPPALVLTVNGAATGSGTYAINTQLGDSSSPSDTIVLNGAAASASGTNKISVTNAGGTGAVTTGNGILVVSATGGATTSASSFALAGPVTVVNGQTMYTYSLKQVGNNWYLQSTSGPVPVVAQVPTLEWGALLALIGALGVLGWSTQKRRH